MADMMRDAHDDYDGNEEREDEVLNFKSINAETDKAWNLTIGGNDFWLPKSQCSIDGSEVTIPYWLKQKNGIRDE